MPPAMPKHRASDRGPPETGWRTPAKLSRFTRAVDSLWTPPESGKSFTPIMIHFPVMSPCYLNEPELVAAFARTRVRCPTRVLANAATSSGSLGQHNLLTARE